MVFFVAVAAADLYVTKIKSSCHPNIIFKQNKRFLLMNRGKASLAWQWELPDRHTPKQASY